MSTRTAKATGSAIGSAMVARNKGLNMSVAAIKRVKKGYEDTKVLVKKFEKKTGQKIIAPLVRGSDYALLISQILYIAVVVVSILTFYHTKTDLWVYTDAGHVAIISQCIRAIKIVNNFNSTVARFLPMAFGTVYGALSRASERTIKRIWEKPDRLRKPREWLNKNNINKVKQSASIGLMANVSRASLPFGSQGMYGAMTALPASASYALDLVKMKIDENPTASARILRQIKLDAPGMMLPFTQQFDQFTREFINTTMSAAVTLSIGAGYGAVKTAQRIAARKPKMLTN